MRRKAEAGTPAPDPAPRVRQGAVSPRVASEFPGLGIASIDVPGGARSSPEPVSRRLRELSDRFYGAHAVHLRERPIPWAYRVFFRQIGLDPDVTRTPVEALALERLEKGAFKSRGLPADALAIAIAETGVAVLAFAAEGLVGELFIRDSVPGESLPGSRRALSPGTLVIADARAPVCTMFGAPPEERAVAAKTERTTIAAVQVAGVPQIAVEEALWLVAGALGTA